MRLRNSEIFYPENLLEAQNILKDYPDSRIIAGGTGCFFSETDRCFDLPEFILSTKKLAELKGISKTERYIDIGAGVSLNKLLSLGKKNIPEILYDGISKIANPHIRNLATIGGNIASQRGRMTLFSILLVLDSKLEIKTGTETIWISFLKYFTQKDEPNINTPSFISKIRIPLENWDAWKFSVFNSYTGTNEGVPGFSMLVKMEKNIIMDLRIAYTGKNIFRNREMENRLAGHSLPLGSKDINEMMDISMEYISNIQDRNPITKKRIQNLIFDTLEKSGR